MVPFKLDIALSQRDGRWANAVGEKIVSGVPEYKASSTDKINPSHDKGASMSRQHRRLEAQIVLVSNGFQVMDQVRITHHNPFGISS